MAMIICQTDHSVMFSKKEQHILYPEILHAKHHFASRRACMHPAGRLCTLSPVKERENLNGLKPKYIGNCYIQGASKVLLNTMLEAALEVRG